jgi:hypothetical protein
VTLDFSDSLRQAARSEAGSRACNAEQSRIELAGNGRSELNLGEQVVAWIQNVIALLGNDGAGHREDRAAGCCDPCVSNGVVSHDGPKNGIYCSF